ncbi:Hypothetical predicted protein, partial [Pelobates cultripes]
WPVARQHWEEYKRPPPKWPPHEEGTRGKHSAGEGARAPARRADTLTGVREEERSVYTAAVARKSRPRHSRS